jgi:hypothetical protein
MVETTQMTYARDGWLGEVVVDVSSSPPEGLAALSC